MKHSQQTIDAFVRISATGASHIQLAQHLGISRNNSCICLHCMQHRPLSSRGSGTPARSIQTNVQLVQLGCPSQFRKKTQPRKTPTKPRIPGKISLKTSHKKPPSHPSSRSNGRAAIPAATWQTFNPSRRKPEHPPALD